MAALFSKPKTPKPPKPVTIEAPAAPPAPPVSPAQTAAPEQAILRRRRKGQGLAGLILSPLGGSSAGKQTLGGGGVA